ncbi:MAG: hypothetical protein GYB67_04270 [Chloroflexi bacterium]|nr:hypothetical protein [Chloroflexota bacterium]
MSAIQPSTNPITEAGSRTLTAIDTQELPIWMRRARRGIDWGVLIVIAFSVIAAWPFMLQPGLPRTNASENYVFRAEDYATALREGVWYPRWSPNVMGGYGAPIPHFTPPGAGYFPALIQIFFTDNAVAAVRAVYIIAFMLAGPTVYALVLRRAGASAGVLAALLYVYSPYVGLTAPHLLGDVPGVMSLALLPVLLWSVDRLIGSNHPPDLLYVALATAALILTHSLAAAVSIALAVIFVLWHVLVCNRHAPWRSVVGGLLLGFGLAATFWLPLLADLNTVTFHYRDGVIQPMLTLGGLFAPVQPVDPAALVPVPQLTLGLVNAGFALSGAAALIHRRQQRRLGRSAAWQALMLVIGVALIVISLALPTQHWLLGALTLCCAIGGSAALRWRDLLPERVRHLLLPVAVIVLLVTAAPIWLARDWQEAFGAVKPADQVRYELNGFGTAVLPPDAPLPLTIAPTLELDPALYNSIGSPRDVNKIAAVSGPVASFEPLAHGTHADSFFLRATGPVTVSMLTAYFPGWRAVLNDVDVPIAPDAQTGLINIDLARCISREALNITSCLNGDVQVFLDTTPLRLLAWASVWTSLALLAVITVRRFRNLVPRFDEPPLLPPDETRLLATLCVGVIAAVLLIAPANTPISLRASPYYQLEDAQPLLTRANEGSIMRRDLETLAYRLAATEYRVGETVPLTLYWHTLNPNLPANYRTSAFLLNLSGGANSPATPLSHLGGYPTRRWPTDRYAQNTFHVSLAGVAPGEYSLAVEVYDCESACRASDRLAFFDPATRESLGRRLVLPFVIITVTP